MKTCIHSDRMKVNMMILLFAIFALSSLKQGSALVPDGYIEENVALRGRATQSSVHPGGGIFRPINAIDGNRNPYYNHGSCAHTENEANPWWRVDLLKMYTITSVTITNIGVCCGNKLWGARILIGNSLENNGINNPQCSVIKSLPTGGTETLHCPQPMIGRYVTVYLPKHRYLHFCEIEVNALLPAPQK